MTDRVLRWLAGISLGLLALNAAWTLVTLPTFVVHLPVTVVPTLGPEYILGNLVLPTTSASIGEVAGIATLVISVQRRQWGWFSGVLLCLVIYSYAGLAIDLPATFTFLYKLAGNGGVYMLRAYLALYFVVTLAPLLVVAAVYAWTRRQPVTARAAT